MSNESRTCPQCGAAITGDAPQGLCPKCLLAGVALGTEPGELTGPHGTKILQPAPALDAVRAAFPQLEVLQLIGRGGMGVVYQARQKSLNRLVALKLLAPERVTDAKFAERFTREAQALARLSHPNIVTIHDFGVATPPPTPDAIPHPPFYFLLMEFVDGVNLRQAMKAGRFTPEQALAIVPPVCDALQYAHERGIVHRDIKPENLLLDKDGRVKIADFGIAKMLGESGTGVPPVSEEHTGGTPVPHSVAAGTPQYMAPEQREHHRTDHRADIYSLGVVLYELLTGELPGKRLEAPSRKVQIDVRLDEIVLRALEVKPELRYQTAGELRSQVQTVVSTPRASETPAIHAGASSPTKTCRCYVSTPEHLATIWGKIYIYTGNGRLMLDANNLTFIEAVGNTTIPLGSIRALSIGEYPRLTKPTGLDFISVTFEDAGRVRELYFTPNEGGFRPTWDTNQIVAEWFTAIRDAATNATGRAPAAKPKDRLTASPGLTAILAITLVAVLLATFLGSSLILWLVRQFSGGPETAPFNGTLFGVVLVCVLALLGAMLFVRRIGRAAKAGGPAVDSPSDRTHSGMQAALQSLLPASWFEAIRRESLEWKMVCDCGWKTSIWEVGDIRFKASARQSHYGWCPQCVRRKSMKLLRPPSGEVSAEGFRAPEETAASTAGSSQSKAPQTEPGAWSGWGIVGSAVGLTSWIVLTTILSGWSGAGVALSQATVGIIFVAALVLWNARHRISEFCGHMWLVAVGFLASSLFLFGADSLGLSMIASWPGGAKVSPLKFAWVLWFFPLVALRLWIRKVRPPSAKPTLPPPTQSRWQGWDVWVIGLCLAIFGALWLLQLTNEQLLHRPLYVGAGAGSNVVLPVALATTILLAGAAFLFMLARNIKTASPTRSDSWKRTLGRAIVPAIAVALLLRTFIIQPFWSVTDATAPEIPRGSLVLVWKPTRTFAAGELIAYVEKGRVNLGRIDKPSREAVFIKRNDSEPTSVLHSAIIGKVISVLWRASAPSGVTQFDIAPVGVSNNVVIVDVTTEVKRGNAELRAVLDGPPPPATTEAGVQSAFSPAFAGTIVRPTLRAGTHPRRLLSTGRQTWRLGFVLPDAALAKQALDDLRPIGHLPAVGDRTMAGTLFKVRDANGAEFHASLHVALPITPEDPNWVSVSSAPSTPDASALSSYNESGGVIMKWEVLASQPGIVFLHREGSQSTVSLRRDPKTKLYQVAIRVELTQAGTDRVLLVTTIGGSTAREELSGNLRELSAELWSYKNLSATSARGTEIELCRFQGKPISVLVPVLKSTVTPSNSATSPAIQRVEISPDKAVVHSAHYDGSGLLITFGTGTNRWTPSGVYLDGLFNVTLEWQKFGTGALHVIQPRHGIHFNYRLDGPPGPMLGKLVFHPRSALPDAGGSCVIGEFQPETGEPLPIAVKFVPDQATPPASASTNPAMTGRSNPAPVTVVRPSFAFITIIGLLVIAGVVLGAVALLVLLVRKGGTAGKVVALVLALPLLLLVLAAAALVGYKKVASDFGPGVGIERLSQPGQMVLESSYPVPMQQHPPGEVQQAGHGFRLTLPASQLATFEFSIRQADDSWERVPSLTALVATGEDGRYSGSLDWRARRGNGTHVTNQLWFWTVSVNESGGRPLPQLADHGTNFTHHVPHGDTLDWWQLAVPAQLLVNSGEQRTLPLFRTFGTATARGGQPKEARIIIRYEPLPAGFPVSRGQHLVQAGLTAQAHLQGSAMKK